jgi:uncharacterized protein (DUF2147 family)
MQSLNTALLIIAAQYQTLAAPLVGHWINPLGTVIVEVLECGEAALCGSVRWASEEAVADARAAGTEPLVGTELFHHLTARSDGRWTGKLFVPDLRRTHSAEISLTSRGQLKVRGCTMARLICRSQLWARAEIPTPP